MKPANSATNMTRKPNRSVADGGVFFEDPLAGIVVVSAERLVVELDVVSEDVVDMAAWNVCRGEDGPAGRVGGAVPL
jgi:hypothetical protein